MSDTKLALSARFTPDEYRLLEGARLRFRCKSLAQFLHDAALHYAGHNRNTVRPSRAFKFAAEKKQEEMNHA